MLDHYRLLFDRAADFLLVLDGSINSRLLVQERYDTLRSTYAQNVRGFDTYVKENQPDKNSPLFEPIDMILNLELLGESGEYITWSEAFETGYLTYGNANPDSPDFNSLADFICNGDDIEVKLPWQLLNFADPSNMEIHDDYYDGNYGVAYQNIDTMYVGVGTTDTKGRIRLSPFALKGWGNDVTSHERLKRSYYILKDLWTTP